MNEQPTATLEGLLRRYPAFSELDDDRLVGWRRMLDRFIARLVKSYFGLIECLNIASVLLRVVVDSSMTTLACVDL